MPEPMAASTPKKYATKSHFDAYLNIRYTREHKLSFKLWLFKMGLCSRDTTYKVVIE